MSDLRYTRTGFCTKCGACCKDLTIKIAYRIPGDVAQYLKARGLEIEWGAKFTVLHIKDYPCPHLNNDNSCSLYNTESMPRVCFASPCKKWNLHKDCNYKIEVEKR